MNLLPPIWKLLIREVSQAGEPQGLLREYEGGGPDQGKVLRNENPKPENLNKHIYIYI